MGIVSLNNHFNVSCVPAVLQLDNYQLAFPAFLAVGIWMWFGFYQLDALQRDLNSDISSEGRTVVVQEASVLLMRAQQARLCSRANCPKAVPDAQITAGPVGPGSQQQNSTILIPGPCLGQR